MQEPLVAAEQGLQRLGLRIKRFVEAAQEVAWRHLRQALEVSVSPYLCGRIESKIQLKIKPLRNIALSGERRESDTLAGHSGAMRGKPGAMSSGSRHSPGRAEEAWPGPYSP
jgi:hypothetical protein